MDLERGDTAPGPDRRGERPARRRRRRPRAGYTLLDHTADAGLVAWGPDPPAAFAQAARGMFALILGQDPVAWEVLPTTLDRPHGPPGRPAIRAVTVEGRDWESLLVRWLSELLFLFEVDGFVPRLVAVDECAPPRCVARLAGFELDDPSAVAGVGVKAVTYHQLRVDIGPRRTELRVIFDI
jgi:SHS2 domain-containing protein